MEEKPKRRPSKRRATKSHVYTENIITEEDFETVYSETTNVKFVSCHFNPTGMSFVRAYPSLKILIVETPSGAFHVQELYHAQKLEELQVIDLSEHPSSDFRTLRGIEFCQNLTVLTLKHVPVKDLSFLNGMNIRHLNLDSLNDCTLPEDLPVIENLRVFDCDISSVPYYPSLVFLDCTENCVKSLRRYSGSKLQKLIARRNSLRHIPDLPNAKIIDVSNNRIKSLVPNDPEFVSVALILSVSGNRLTSLEGLENYPYLTELVACRNQIEDISSLQEDCSMDGIRTLDLSNNLISEIPSMKINPYGNARWDFSNNPIRDVRPILSAFETKHCSHLRIYGTCLSDKSITAIETSPNLKSKVSYSKRR